MSVEVGSKLAAVVAAIDKAFCDAASQSQWIASDDGQIRTDDDPVHRCYIGAIVEPDDAAMIVATVNFLREHQADLAALQAKLDAVTKDSESWRAWKAAQARVEEEMPEGYAITMHCSPGDWDIDLVDPSNKRIEIYDYDDVANFFNRAIDAALTDQGRAGEGRGDG